MNKYYREDGEDIPAIMYVSEAPEGFTEITDHEELKQLHAKRYRQTKEDGTSYVINYTAEIYLNIVDGLITETEAFFFEMHTNILLKQIEGGHWLTASNTNLNIPLSGIYDQARKEGLQNDIDNYILENY
jgi:hypothetical protein